MCPLAKSFFLCTFALDNIIFLSEYEVSNRHTRDHADCVQVFLVTGSGWWGHPEDYGYVTLSAGSGEGSLPAYCGCVIPDAGSGT